MTDAPRDDVPNSRRKNRKLVLIVGGMSILGMLALIAFVLFSGFPGTPQSSADKSEAPTEDVRKALAVRNLPSLISLDLIGGSHQHARTQRLASMKESSEALLRTRVAVDQMMLSRLATQSAIERSRNSLAETRTLLVALQFAVRGRVGRPPRLIRGSAALEAKRLLAKITEIKNENS